MKINPKVMVVSWTVTFIVVMIGMLGLGVLLGNKRVRDYQRGWNLVNVVVPVRDLRSGVELTRADLTVRGIPEQFVVTALKEPELQKAVGQRLSIPLKKNDQIDEWMLEPQPLPSSCRDEAAAAAKAANLEGSADVTEALQAIAEMTADGGADGR